MTTIIKTFLAEIQTFREHLVKKAKKFSQRKNSSLAKSIHDQSKSTIQYISTRIVESVESTRIFEIVDISKYVSQESKLKFVKIISLNDELKN